MIYLTLIILGLILFFIIYKNNTERFRPNIINGLSYGEYNYNSPGFYRYSNNNFKKMQCHYYSNPKNMIRVNRHRIETKLPVLAKHRLDYNDKRIYYKQLDSNYNNLRILPGKARLTNDILSSSSNRCY